MNPQALKEQAEQAKKLPFRFHAIATAFESEVADLITGKATHKIAPPEIENLTDKEHAIRTGTFNKWRSIMASFEDWQTIRQSDAFLRGSNKKTISDCVLFLVDIGHCGRIEAIDNGGRAYKYKMRDTPKTDRNDLDAILDAIQGWSTMRQIKATVDVKERNIRMGLQFGQFTGKIHRRNIGNGPEYKAATPEGQ
jgi:hypothetical protein